MKNRNVKELTRADRDMATKKEPLGANILRSDVLVVTDYALLYRNAGIRMGQPYRSKEPRIMLVTSGKAKIEVNGIGFQLLPNSVILVPANGTVEIQTMDADFNGCALVFPISMYKEEYGRMLFHPQHLDVSDSEAGLLKDYFSPLMKEWFGPHWGKLFFSVIYTFYYIALFPLVIKLINKNK